MCDARVHGFLFVVAPATLCEKGAIKKVQLTFSCLKKHNIFNSLKTRFDDTSDWNTLGSFLSATRRPSRGSVTALQIKQQEFKLVHAQSENVWRRIKIVL